MRTVLLVDHRVADFDAWKQVYDGVREMQRAGGVRSQQVLRDPADGNRVVVTHTFDSREAAEAFAENPELQVAMGRAGVDPSSVKLEYFDEVESEDV
jgi:heme-degrading monooxygenase HmoA